MMNISLNDTAKLYLAYPAQEFQKLTENLEVTSPIKPQTQ